jgi:hypothetical protein
MLKRYIYNDIRKDALDKVVWQILSDTVSFKADTLDDLTVSGGQFWLFVTLKKYKYRYTLTYMGGKYYWEKSKNSELVIISARNDLGEGGMEGFGDFKGKAGLKVKLIKAFEEEFIAKVDSMLGGRALCSRTLNMSAAVGVPATAARRAHPS